MKCMVLGEGINSWLGKGQYYIAMMFAFEPASCDTTFGVATVANVIAFYIFDCRSGSNISHGLSPNCLGSNIPGGLMISIRRSAMVSPINSYPSFVR